MRRFVRSRYDYVNGGTDSYVRAHQWIFELEWEYLSAADLTSLKSIITALTVQPVKDVRLDNLNGITYNATVDIDQDDFADDAGDVFQKRPAKVTFITRVKQTT